MKGDGVTHMTKTNTTQILDEYPLLELAEHSQNIMVEGRALSIQDPTSFNDGETNFIMVDRYNILKTSFDEVKCLKNLRKTLEVQFYGEVS